MRYDNKTTTVKSGANTQDIINALEAAVPRAVTEVVVNSNRFPIPTGNPVQDGKRAAEFIRDNVRYKADGYKYQDIQLPARMLAGTKQADCKSFSLASVAQCLAAGHRCGFRFASYKPNKIPTHVYFWILDKSGKKFTFDPTIRNLKESPKATNTIDMELRYMTGADDFPEIGRKGRGKKIFMAPARNGYLVLVRLNFRGLATKQGKLLAKNPTELKQFWEKLGGKFDALKSAINAGKNKRPVFGSGVRGIGTYDYYITQEGGGKEGKDTLKVIQELLPIVGPILTAIQNLFKKNKIEDPTVVDPGQEKPLDPTGDGFVVEDNENKTTPDILTTGFKPSPLLIGGAIGAVVLIYFLTSKKRR
jgi:hypothetical protein